MQLLSWRMALWMAPALLASDAAWAQLLKPNMYPPAKDALLLLEMARPSDTPELLHGWRGNLGYQYGDLESKLASQPETRALNYATAGLNARVGARGFAGIDLTYSDQRLDLRNRGNAINGEVDELGLRATGGIMLLPFLAVGASIGRSSLDGVYQFGVGAPKDQSSGTLVSTSFFATALYPAGDWKFTLTGVYAYDEARQSFADGAPAEQKANARSASLAFAALHPITARLDGTAGLALHHIMDHKPFLAGRGLDEDWLRPSLGLIYRLTEQTSLVLNASIYLMNESYDYDSVSLGLSYKF